jgi:hypothetical protein
LAALGKKKSVISRRLKEAFEARHPDEAARKDKLAFYRMNYNDQRQGSGPPYWQFLV